MRLSQQSAPCGKCGDQIKAGSNAIIALGKKFHEGCFACQGCRKKFETGYLDYRGVPYHQECLPKGEDEEYSTLCAKCNKTIDGPLTLAAGKSFCSNCFKCSKCNKIIDSNFDVIDDLLYHPQCVPSGALPICRSCNQPCQDKSVIVDGNFFHNSCLVCAKCVKPLGSSSHYASFESKLYHYPECMPAAGWNKDTCESCTRPLSNPACEVDGKTYHISCFVCAVCHKPFSSSYAKTAGVYHHETCKYPQ